MTPFGELLRGLRRARGVNQKEMAEDLGVSAAYLSALEHGQRGTPSFAFRQKVIAWANVIWDEAEALERTAQLSDPRVVVDTRRANAKATRLANRLAEEIDGLDDEELDQMLSVLDRHRAK